MAEKSDSKSKTDTDQPKRKPLTLEEINAIIPMAAPDDPIYSGAYIFGLTQGGRKAPPRAKPADEDEE